MPHATAVLQRLLASSATLVVLVGCGAVPTNTPVPTARPANTPVPARQAPAPTAHSSNPKNSDANSCYVFVQDAGGTWVKIVRSDDASAAKVVCELEVGLASGQVITKDLAERLMRHTQFAGKAYSETVRGHSVVVMPYQVVVVLGE